MGLDAPRAVCHVLTKSITLQRSIRIIIGFHVFFLFLAPNFGEDMELAMICLVYLVLSIWKIEEQIITRWTAMSKQLTHRVKYFKNTATFN